MPTTPTTLLLAGLLIHLLCVFIAVAGLILAQRLIPLELRKAHNNTVGIVYGTLSGIFAIMIGFSAFLVLNKYSESQHTVVSEASDVMQTYLLAEQFPGPQRDQIQEIAHSYAQVVVDEEWPLMGAEQTSPRAEALVKELWRDIQEFEPVTESEKAAYAQGLARMHDLEEDREFRLLNVRTGLPTILWVVLIILGTTIVFFSYLLGMENARLHRLMVIVLSAGITFLLITIVAIDRPFVGFSKVSPAAFELVLNEMEGTGK